jgi:hypothetical protein
MGATPTCTCLRSQIRDDIGPYLPAMARFMLFAMDDNGLPSLLNGSAQYSMPMPAWRHRNSS